MNTPASADPLTDPADPQPPDPLVRMPYADLPDSEKEYDRATALCTRKAILALGYTIEPPEKP